MQKLNVKRFGPNHLLVCQGTYHWYISFETVIAYWGPANLPNVGTQIVRIQRISPSGKWSKATKKHLREMGCVDFAPVAEDIFDKCVP